jgi:uncharacterized coiled-coil DUF342 family protein
MTEIDDLKSKVAKQRNEIARLAADKLQMHRDMLVLKLRLEEKRNA